MSLSTYYLNQRISILQAEINGIVSGGVPTTSDLAVVLTNGNSAGTSDIDMNTNDILAVDNIDLVTINGSAYPPVVGADTLSAVLTAGNNAGTTDIDMNSNDILLVNNIDLVTINGSAYPPVVGADTLSAVLTAGNSADNSIILTDGILTNTINKTGYSTINTSANVTHFLDFSDSSASGTGAIQKTAGLECNPSTKTITATTFTGALSGTATSATNIAGGLGGSIPYQTAVNSTALLANGTAGQVLQSNGTTLAPSWTTPSTTASVVTIADDNTNATFYPVFVSNNTGNLPLKVDKTTNPLSYNPSSGSLSATSVTSSTFTGALVGNASTATTATNVTGGLGGQVLYQSAVNTTAKLANGTAGQVLVSAGTTLAPVWTTTPVAKIFATTAQNILQNVNYFNVPSPQTQLTCLGGVQTNTASMTATANQIIIPKTGYYMVIGSLVLLPTVNVSIQVYLTSGTGGPYVVCRNESTAGAYASGFGSNWLQATGIQYFSSGDVLILTAYQNGVASASVSATTTYLSVSFISV